MQIESAVTQTRLARDVLRAGGVIAALHKQFARRAFDFGKAFGFAPRLAVFRFGGICEGAFHGGDFRDVKAEVNRDGSGAAFGRTAASQCKRKAKILRRLRRTYPAAAFYAVDGVSRRIPEKARISSVIPHEGAVLNALLTALLLENRGRKAGPPVDAESIEGHVGLTAQDMSDMGRLAQLAVNPQRRRQPRGNLSRRRFAVSHPGHRPERSRTRIDARNPAPPDPRCRNGDPHRPGRTSGRRQPPRRMT